ncbi:MAG: cytosine permease [Acidimicrobiales bacterium]
MTWLRGGGNILLTTFVLGGYYAASLGLAGLVVVTITGAALGNLLPAVSGLRSARYGVDEYVGIRSTYGLRGANIGVLVLVLCNYGWIGIYSSLAGTSASTALTRLGHPVAGSYTLFALVLGIVAPVTILALSPRVVFRVVKYAVPLLILFAVLLLWKELTRFGLHRIAAFRPTHAVDWQYAVEAQVAYGASWLPYMGAWNRFARTERAAFFGTWVGMGFVAVLLSLIGGIATMMTGSPQPSVWAIRSGLGIPVLLLISVSTVVSSAVLLYSSAEALRTAIPRLPTPVVLVAAAAPSIALVYEGSLTSKFSVLLTIAGGIIAPYWGVALGDYFLLRGQRLDVASLVESGRSPYWYLGGFNLLAVGTWLVGVAAWLCVGGWQTPYRWLAFAPGRHVFEAVTATAPIVVLSALLYTAAVRFALRRAVGPANLLAAYRCAEAGRGRRR